MTHPSIPADFSARFLAPLTEALRGASHARSCVSYPDVDHLHAGVLRVLDPVASGRDWVQTLIMRGKTFMRVGGFFDALESPRRMKMVGEVSNRVLAFANTHLREADPFAVHPELKDFALYATDGHSHAASAHEEPIQGQKRAVTWIYALNLRTHTVSPLALCSPALGKKKEHEISTLKRMEGKDMRMGHPCGTRVIHAYDPAIVDYAFWDKLKKGRGVYILTLEKANSALAVIATIPFDVADPRNNGVVSDEFVGPAHGGMLRRITYVDPVSGKTYCFLTNEFTIPPGLLAFIYKSRWDVEKLYDVFKNKFDETKAWAKSTEAKTQQAFFIALAHNLMKILEHDLRTEEGLEDQMSLRRRVIRNAADASTALKAGRQPNPMVLSWRRTTQISLQFIRWLRHCLWQNISWRAAVDALRPLTRRYLS